MKRLIITALMVCLLAVCLFLLPNKAQAATLASGTCGDNLTWVLDDTGTLTISGTGAMTDWRSDSGQPWRSNKNAIKKVVINNGVTSIGDYAFMDCTGLISATIPDSVTSIGWYTFYKCTNLSSLTMGNGVTSIGYAAFCHCTSLTSVMIPNSVTSIVNSAFYGCTSLNSVTIGNGLSSVGNGAFENTAWYDNQPDGLVYAGKVAYKYKGTCPAVVTIEAGTLGIAENAFYNCAELTSVTIPDGVLNIGYEAFRGCSGLISVTIPDSVTSIGGGAFNGCSSLESITIPFVGDSRKTASDPYQYPFGYIFGTSSYTGGTAITQFYYGSDVGPVGTTSTLYYIPASLKNVTVTGGNILYCAFYNCSGLTSVTLSDGVISIGDRAFYGCSGLTSVTISDSVQSIGYEAFSGCSALTSITVGSGVTSIAINAFNGTAWYNNQPDGLVYAGKVAYKYKGTCPATVVIKDGTLGIAAYAFVEQNSLKSVTIPASLINIDDYAFSSCTNLTDFNFNAENMKDLSITNFVFNNAGTNGTGIKVVIGSTVTKIPAYLFYSYSNISFYSPKLASVEFEEGSVCQAVGEFAFYMCTGLTSVTIPASVNSIGIAAFACGLTGIGVDPDNAAYCNNSRGVLFNKDKTELIQVPGAISGYYYSGSPFTVPDSVTRIGAYAFSGCGKITSVLIPASVISIGENAFLNCGNLYTTYINELAAWCAIDFENSNSNPLLSTNSTAGAKLYLNGELITKLEIPQGVTSISSYAFMHCSNITSVSIPDSVRSIGNNAFYRCAGLTSVTIPDSVTSLGESAFYGCGKLTALTLGNGLTEIPKQAFTHASFTSVTIPDNVTTIGMAAFSGCYDLTDVVIPDSVTNIGGLAFRNCLRLTSISFGAGLKTIGNSAFYDCRGLRSVMLPDGVTSIDGQAFDSCTSLNSISFGAGVETIGAYAFYNCSALRLVMLRNGVTLIDRHAFDSCAIEKVIYCGEEEQWNAITIKGDNDGLTTAERSYHQWVDAACPATKICSVCSEIQGVSQDHTGTWFEVVKQECTKPGIKAMVCNGCKETITEELPAKGHTYVDVVTPPTCTDTGFTTRVCSSCGDCVVTDSVAATGHSFTEEIDQGAKTCTTCGVTIIEHVPAEDHSWSAWIISVKPTCTQEGTQVRFCYCGAKETMPAAKLIHSIADGTCTICNAAMSGHVVLTTDLNLAGLGLTEDLYIDLNGFDLSGVISTNGYKVYGMDSTTDNYTCEAIGYMNLVDENGKEINPVTHFKSGITGETKRYIAIKDNSGYSFHRFYIGITHQSLKPTTVGVGYKAVFYGDTMVAANLDSFGFTMTLGDYTPKTVTKDASSFVSGKTVTLRVDNFDVDNYGETNLYAAVMLELADGTVIESTQCAMTMRNLLETLNTNYTALDTDQLTAVADLIKKYAIISTWKVENLIAV